MSALLPKADILRGGSDVRFVPKADIGCTNRQEGWLFPEPRLAGRRSWVTSRNLMELPLHVAKLSLWGRIECLLRASLTVP